MHKKHLNKVNNVLFYLEQRCGIYFTSLIIAFLLLCIAAIYVTPAMAPMQLGRGYAALSIAPFDFSEQNYLRYRILTPFLAYCVGLRGSLYILFPLIISLFFLSTIYFYIRKTHKASESLLITMLICFSTPVLFLLHFQGYVDITSYLLILLIIFFIKKPFICIIFLSLLLLNHASNIFSIPFLFFYYYKNSPDKLKSTIYSITGIGLAFIPFYCYRNYISAYSGIEYHFETYRSQIIENINTVASHFLIGVFFAFKLFWLIVLFALYYYWKEKNNQQLLLFVVIIIPSFAQMLLASDTSRFIGSAFPAILFGAIKLKEQWGTELFLKRTFYLILINFLIPQYYVGQSVMIRFYPLPSSLIYKYVFGIETWVG
ncbi:MAG: hypothetical protein V4511_15315 [Bacteroidota bacterium]